MRDGQRVLEVEPKPGKGISIMSVGVGRWIVMLALACTGCTHHRSTLPYEGNIDAIQELGKAALDCGFFRLELTKGSLVHSTPEPPAATATLIVVPLVERKANHLANACLNRWLRARPELDIGYILRMR
jgi:hypothetical protein